MVGFDAHLLGQAVAAVARRKDEGDMRRFQMLGDGITRLTRQVDVEHGSIRLVVAQYGDGLADAVRMPDIGAAQLLQHVLDENGEDRFVLDEEESARLRNAIRRLAAPARS